MIKPILALILLIFMNSAAAQVTPEFNLNFEAVKNDVPKYWQDFGDEGYNLKADSTVKKEGAYSALIESTIETPDFAAWSFSLPQNYDGKKITLSGFIKSENVDEGFFGLWMRIDPGIAFNNMQKRNLSGTTDWTKYEISLKMDPEKTDQIVIGGLLSGPGKVWFDDFTVTVDGKDIRKLKPFEREAFPAELDHEFDEGSGLTDIAVNAQQVDNLTALGYVWGFMKYYHPKVSNGDYNWDYELFRILPKVLEAKTTSDRDKVLLNWIDSYGKLTTGKKPKIAASTVKIAPDLNWIDSSNFSEDLSSKLHEIEAAKRSDENYYVGLFSGVRNPEFKNENPYSTFSYPDAGYRLLSLYRYWNIIHYYFPYKYLIEEDWKDVLGEFVPKFLAAEDQTQYTLACLELITRVNDTHANIWGGTSAVDDYWGNNYPPFAITFVEEKAVVTNFYDEDLGQKSGLQVGDVIESVNGKTVDDIVNEQLNLTPASNYSVKLRNIARRLLNTNDSIIQLTFKRNDQIKAAKFPSYTPEELNLFGKYNAPDSCFRMINENIAYINNGTLQTSYLREIWEAIKDSKGLIIDIRKYPSDFPIYALSEYLMPQTTEFVTFTSGSVTSPGYFTFGQTASVGKKNKDYYQGKVILLVNENSQSSSEFHAMAYRVHPNATVIGSTTAGADGNVSRFYLPGGIATLITGIGVYYPDRSETQRVGIVPDIECRPTIEGIRDGRDELVEKAVEVIEKM